VRAFLELLRSGKINIDSIITHRFSFGDAPKAYREIESSEDIVLGAFFEYRKDVDMNNKFKISRTVTKSPVDKRTLGIGFIGAGSYAQQFLLPIMTKLPDVFLTGLVTATGPNAKYLGEKFGFEFITTDGNKVVNDENTDVVAIVTRHNLHAKYVVDALQAGKHVYVEKPLALNEDELSWIVDAYNNSNKSVMIGFNRRFSPHTVRLKKFLAGEKIPLAMNIRINAGFKEKDKWQQDPAEGGGRIIGEVCHFVDLAGYICDSKPISVYATALQHRRDDIASNDTVVISISYDNGSIVTISYFSNGDTNYPKERIEVFGGNSIFVIDDFRKSVWVTKGRKHRFATKRQDKGQHNGLSTYTSRVIEKGSSPIPFQEIVTTSRVTFAILQSIREKRVIPIA